MLLNEFIELIVERENDAFYRDVANISFQKILNKNFKKLIHEYKQYDGTLTFILSLKKIPFENYHSNINIIFAIQREPLELIGKYINRPQSNSQSIVLYYVMPKNITNDDQLRKYFYKNCKQLFVSYKSTYVHEFIHHLDTMRSKIKTMDFTGREMPQGIDYFNDPLELNAHYQQIADQFEEAIHQETSPELIDILQLEDEMKSKKFFMKLVELFLQEHEPNLWNNLSDQNKQRYLKRFYSLYDDLKQIVDELYGPPNQ